MFKKSTLSVIGLVCLTIWTLGLAGCSDSKENTARKQLLEATRYADELCRAAMAVMANPGFDREETRISELLEQARKKLNTTLKETQPYAADMPETIALAKSSLAQIENVNAQYKYMAATSLLSQSYAMMDDIFNLAADVQTATTSAKAAKDQTSFDVAAFTSKIQANEKKIKETSSRLANIKSALDEKKQTIDTLVKQMNDMALKSQELLGESRKLPVGKERRAKLDEALSINDESAKIQAKVTTLESEAANLATLTESLELNIKSLQGYNDSLKASQTSMQDITVKAAAVADVLENAANKSSQQLTAKCEEFRTLQKDFCTTASECQKGFEKSADLLRSAQSNASEDFKTSMQLKQAELALAAVSLELDMIAFKKQVEGLQKSLNEGGMNIAIDEGVKSITTESMANAAVNNAQEAINMFDRVLRATPTKGKWRMHSALASANIMLCRALRETGKADLADNALRTAQVQLAQAREKSKWLAKASLDAIEEQIKQAK